MKLRVGLLAMCLSLNVFAGAGGHGGDPYLTIAESFPDQEKLEKAYTLALEKVEQASLKEEFKQTILDEMKSIKENNLFLYLESVVVITKDGDDTYELPADARSFLSIGAMTGENKGEAIYFSKRSLKHDLETFSKLMIHEVLHHVAIPELSKDEGFVEDLTAGIMKGEISKSLEYAYLEGIYIRPGVLKADQLFNKLYQKFRLSYSAFLGKEIRYSKEEVEETKKKFLQNFKNNNLNDSAISSVMDAILEARFTHYKDIVGDGVAQQMLYDVIHNAFKYEGRELIWKSYYGCKVKLRTFQSCSEKNKYKISDLF